MNEAPRFARARPRSTRLLDYAPKQDTHLDEALIRALAETHSYRSGMPQQRRRHARRARGALPARRSAQAGAVALQARHRDRSPRCASARRTRSSRTPTSSRRPSASGASAFASDRDRLHVVRAHARRPRDPPAARGPPLRLRSHDRQRARAARSTTCSIRTSRPTASASRTCATTTYASSIIDGKSPEVTITRGGTDKKPHGMAEFIAQEEFDRERGFWFAPDGKHVAFEEVDQSDVETLSIVDPAHPEREPDKAYYPRAGKTNAVIALRHRVDAAAATRRGSSGTRRSSPTSRPCVWDEGAPLTIYVLDRAQKNGELLAVDDEDRQDARAAHRARRRVAQRGHERPAVDAGRKERSSGRPSATGAWELELREAGRQRHRARARSSPPARAIARVARSRLRQEASSSSRRARSRRERSPCGPSRSRGGVAAADRAARRRRRRHLRHVPRAYRRLHRHHDELPAPTSCSTRRASSSRTLPTRGRARRGCREVELRTRRRRRLPRRGRAAARLRCRSHKYPVVDAAYGGPGVNVVTARRVPLHSRADDRRRARRPSSSPIDARGTPYRDRAWERALAGKFGDAPGRGAHRGAARARRARCPEIDLDRVGVYGWSFGGYFAAAAVLSHPELYKAGVAGAPPADWHDYDTAYTERYLGVPDVRRRRTTRHDRVAARDERTQAPVPRPLLLLHGTADDNVYFRTARSSSPRRSRARTAGHVHPARRSDAPRRRPAHSLLQWRLTAEFLRDSSATPQRAESPRRSNDR